MPTYKVSNANRTEFLYAKNEAQLSIAVRQIFGDQAVKTSIPSKKEMDALMRSHSFSPDEE